MGTLSTSASITWSLGTVTASERTEGSVERRLAAGSMMESSTSWRVPEPIFGDTTASR